MTGRIDVEQEQGERRALPWERVMRASHACPALTRYAMSLHSEPHIMRSFDDAQGNRWEAAMLDASYGIMLVIFSRMGGDEVLKNELDAASLLEAEQLLAAMDEASLRAALLGAVPWN